MMLRVDDYRFAFVSVDGISTLISILSSRVNFQVTIRNRVVTVVVTQSLLPGSIPARLLLVGVDLQSAARREDEQVQCHSDLG